MRSVVDRRSDKVLNRLAGSYFHRRYAARVPRWRCNFN